VKSSSILSIALLLFQSISLAQAPDTLWTKTIGGTNDDWGSSVKQTTDGGYIIAASTDPSGSFFYYDVWLIKTNDSGDILWTKTFGGNHDDQARSVQQTDDGGYIVAGRTHSYGVAYYDVWLIKTDASGDTLWTKTFGGGNIDWANSVIQTIDEGYIIVGETHSFGIGDPDVWLIKTDALGDTLWTRRYGGSPGGEMGYSVQETTDGGYIIVGSTDSFGAGNDDVWLIKTDALGDTLWTRTFGGSHSDYGYSVQQTTDGGYILTGYTDLPFAQQDDILLIKTDSSGDTLWMKRYDNWGQSYFVQQTAEGEYIIVGGTDSFGAGSHDVCLIKIDALGDTLWTRTFGGSDSDYGYSVQQTTDGGYILTGYTNSFGAGFSDVWLIKTTPDISSIEQSYDIIPLDFSLHQNYPNPFNPSAKIKYSIPQSSNVIIKVFDILGREIETLVNQEKPTGTYEITWYAENLPSGVYFYRLQAGDFIQTKKMILMK
jgi:hypothetical protein